MPLVLQIENCDRLPDGGPVRMVVGPQGAQVGRAAGMHWVLPDPARHISSHHFDISFAEGAWWLTDRSTNGTFLRGSRYRLEGAHRLAHLDRFQVGHYTIVALIEEAAPQALAAQGWSTPAPALHAPALHAPASPAPASPAADPWTEAWGAPAAAPAAAALPMAPYPQPFAPAVAPMARREDFGDEFITAPVYQPSPAALPDLPPAPFPSAILRGAEPEVAQPASPFPLSPPPLSPPPLSPLPAAGPHDAPDAPVAADAVLAAFCAGAGLTPAALAGVDAVALAHALGRSLRATSAEVMTQLQLRAAAKQFTKGGERTMRQAEHNNPLKFLPDVEQALEAMYLRPRAGFLQGPEALAEALLDLRRHQVALFAALQPALGALLEDLAPEEVEKAGGGGGLLGGSRKAKAWETFVERWDAKAAPHENGMLDEFLRHFAAAYQESVAAQGGGGQG